MDAPEEIIDQDQDQDQDSQRYHAQCIFCERDLEMDYVRDENCIMVQNTRIAHINCKNDFDATIKKANELFTKFFGEDRYYGRNDFNKIDQLLTKSERKITEILTSFSKFMEREIVFIKSFHFLVKGINGTHGHKAVRIDLLEEVLNQVYENILDEKSQFPKQLPLNHSIFSIHGYLEHSWDFAKLHNEKYLLQNQNKKLTELLDTIKENHPELTEFEKKEEN